LLIYLGIEEEARCAGYVSSVQLKILLLLFICIAAFSIPAYGVENNKEENFNNETSDQWMPKPPLVLPYKPVFVGPKKYDSTTPNSTSFYPQKISK